MATRRRKQSTAVFVVRCLWVAYALVVGVLYALPLDRTTTDTISDLGFGAGVVGLVLCMANAARRATGLDRIAWLCLAASGAVILGLFLLEPSDQNGSPTTALLAAPLVPLTFLGAILIFGRKTLSTIGLVSMLSDGTWLVSGIVVASWSWAFAPLPSLITSTPQLLVLGGFPVVAALCAGVTVSLLPRSSGSARLALASLGLGAATTATAGAIHIRKALEDDLVFGTPTDYLWNLGLALLGLSTLDPSMGVRLRASAPSARTQQLITTIPILLLLIPFFVDRWQTTPPAAGFLMVAMLGVRQVLLTATNHRLTNRLAEQASKDELTGLLNRRAIMEILEGATGERNTNSILYLDLDGFKDINDRFGHAAGDHVLRIVATRLLLHTRVSEPVARLGGDEFVILTGSEPEALAERLQAEMIHPIEWNGRQLRVDCSIGVASAPELEPTDRLAVADAALYRAKGRGRGGIESADNPSQVAPKFTQADLLAVFSSR